MTFVANNFLTTHISGKISLQEVPNTNAGHTGSGTTYETGTMPLPFNKTLDLKLIALVRENQVIYNPHHPKYLELDSREVAWQRIGDSLRRPAAVCKSRWINIRDMMRRKIRDRIRNPDQRKYNYKYEDQMAFMLPFIKESMASVNEYPDFLEEQCTGEFEGTVHTEDGEAKPNMYKRQYECQDLNPTDPLDVFLMSIGATLRKFSPYHLNQAKSKIFQVVQEFELRQIVDKGASSVNR